MTSVVNNLFCQRGIGLDDLAQLTLIFEDCFQCRLDVLIVVILEVPLVISVVPKAIYFGKTFKAVVVLLDLFPSHRLKRGHQCKFVNKLHKLVGMEVYELPVIAAVAQREYG